MLLEMENADSFPMVLPENRLVVIGGGGGGSGC
jgi:hypothetical protein